MVSRGGGAGLRRAALREPDASTRIIPGDAEDAVVVTGDVVDLEAFALRRARVVSDDPVGLSGALYRRLRTTNAIEKLNSLIASYTHNVKRWRDGRMVLRWVSAALHEATAHFNRVKGYRDLHRLVAALAKLDKETTKAA